jgi:hypothetical protein
LSAAAPASSPSVSLSIESRSFMAVAC